MHPIQDGLWRAGRRHGAEPGTCLKIREALLNHCRHVRRIGRTLQGSDAEAAQLPIAHHRQYGADILDADLHAAIQHIGHICPAIGDMFHLDAGLVAEQLTGNMLRRAHAWRAIGYLARIGARIGNKFLDIARRKIAVRNE